MTDNVAEQIVTRAGIISPHLLRQIWATLAACLLSVSGGMTFGFTAVLLPQLKDDPDFPYDATYDSWIASISPLAMMFGCLVSGTMSDAFGRKRGQLILILPYTIGWFVMGIANDSAIMILGRFITGMCTGAVRPLGLVYIGEISDPQFRAASLIFPALATHVGGLMSHVIGYYIYWRYSAYIFGIPGIICFVILLFLEESPLWLLGKGRIDEGIDSFKAFRGHGDAADEELRLVLEKQEEKGNNTTFKDDLRVVISKPFLKSLWSIFLLFLAMQMCGINTIMFYAQDIFKSTFKGDLDEYMMMLLTDAIRVVTIGVMCVIAKKVKRKLTFLACCYLTTVSLTAFIVYLYFKPEGMLWAAITCLVFYICISSALTSLAWPFVAEIFPNNVRGIGSGISSLISFGLLFISVKISPNLMSTFGDIALYASFAIATFVSANLLAFILPNTDGRTLQEIENQLYEKSSQDIERNNPNISRL